MLFIACYFIQRCCNKCGGFTFKETCLPFGLLSKERVCGSGYCFFYISATGMHSKGLTRKNYRERERDREEEIKQINMQRRKKNKKKVNERHKEQEKYENE